jgi:outer membrane protein assembly factor BamB
MSLESTPVILIMTATASLAANWPAWRGPAGNGVATETGLPVKWSPTENVRWRVDLPERGNSSPVIWGTRIFVSQAIQAQNRRTVMCFNRADGKLLWQSGVTYTENEPTQRSNPYCSGSPVTDGERVIVCFGSPGVYAYDFDGREIWHRDLGKLNHVFGNAVTPVIHGDLCILNFGPDEKARLIALNKKSGETVWEATPPKPDESEIQQGRGGGGFSFARMLAPQILSQADANGDRKVTRDEFSALAEAWFDKLDPDKTGKLTQEQFTGKLGDVLPPPEGFGPPPGAGQGAGGDRPQDGNRADRPRRGGFGPARFAGPGLFSATDADKDSGLTRAELKTTFEKWATDWDSDKSGSLDEEKLRAGLEAALPRPNFGGAGGPRGPGGPGGPPGRDGGPGPEGGGAREGRERGRGGEGRPGGGFGGRGPGGGASWSTPIVITADGHDELILMSPNRLVAFDPATGRQLWFSKGIGGSIFCSPVWGVGILVAMSSGTGGGGAIAVKPGGSGDVTSTNRLWHLERSSSRTGSGVIHEGHGYFIADNGTIECIDLKSGTSVWEERPKGSGSRSTSWSSMVLADGKIYVPNQSGDVFVVRASPKFELLATNSVNESTNASPAVSDGDLVLRTDKSLWCFTNPNK